MFRRLNAHLFKLSITIIDKEEGDITIFFDMAIGVWGEYLVSNRRFRLVLVGFRDKTSGVKLLNRLDTRNFLECYPLGSGVILR